MYMPLRVFESKLGKTQCFVYMLKVFHDALRDVIVMYERFQTGIVNVNAHALNNNSHCRTLL